EGEMFVPSSEYSWVVTKHGGRGGSGLAGGGAGVSTVDNFAGILDLPESWTPGLPTGGAGGSGSPARASAARGYPDNADAGWNYDIIEPHANKAGLHNLRLSPRQNTSNPQSGKFMYRTIADNVPPVINISEINVSLGNGKPYPLYTP